MPHWYTLSPEVAAKTDVKTPSSWLLNNALLPSLDTSKTKPKMKNPGQPQKPLQLVFNVQSVRFNRPGYFFLKLTADNNAEPIKDGGEEEVWVQMPELNNTFMHALSRINDPIKQKEPGQPVAVGDGKFTFFLSRGVPCLFTSHVNHYSVTCIAFVW